MKTKLYSILAAAAMTAALSVPFTAIAADDTVYGTMNIPYADFYAAEFGSAANAYEVDAVSSATTMKWTKTGEGELFEGAYAGQAREDGSGDILGVTYAVAITQADLDALGENNYGFTKLDAQPSAYKPVTVTDGKASFGAVEAERKTAAAEVTLSTETPWGDYLLSMANADPAFSDKYRGVLLKTSDGNAYAMRHEQNIWRGQVAWSSGIKTSEPHGNQLSFEHYKTLMGATITEIDIINTDAVYVISTDTYVPVKFEGSLTVADAAAGTGSTSLTAEGFPDDYQKKYSAGESFTVTDDTVSYTDTLPGSYSLTVHDEGGKYADVTTSFTLTTADLPAAYADGKIVKAEHASDADLQNFLKNISKVEVNEKAYSAAGKGAVAIIDPDGTIDFLAASRDGNVFDGSGNYTMTVTATGYTTPLTFTIEQASDSSAESSEAPDSSAGDSTAESSSSSSSSSSQASSSSASSSSSKSSSSSTTSTASPKTGDASAALPIAAFAAAAGALSVSMVKRKKDE